VIGDPAWFKDTLIPTVQQRGAAIIKARGASSAGSAANAAIATVRALTTPTAPGDCFSVAVCTDGAYGIERGLIYSYPMRSDGKNVEIVRGLTHSEFARGKLTATENELKEEKSLIGELIPGS
jgi:malate dehydrogenase